MQYAYCIVASTNIHNAKNSANGSEVAVKLVAVGWISFRDTFKALIDENKYLSGAQCSIT